MATAAVREYLRDRPTAMEGVAAAHSWAPTEGFGFAPRITTDMAPRGVASPAPGA